MPDVLLRMKALTDRRPVRWWLGLLVLGLSFSTAVPVLALPGYEWSALVSLVLCLLAWPVGVAAGRF